MKHYSKQQWVQFFYHQLPSRHHIQMEMHLKQCDTCLGHYSDIAGQRAAESSLSISEDFMLQILHACEMEDRKTRREQARSSKIRTAVYYMAAACATYLIMVSGLFQALDEGIRLLANNFLYISH